MTGDLSDEEKLKAYKEMGGAVFEGTNEEVEIHPKYTAIYDEKPKRKRKKAAKKPRSKK